jgi:hypothetical protein
MLTFHDFTCFVYAMPILLYTLGRNISECLGTYAITILAITASTIHNNGP